MIKKILIAAGVILLALLAVFEFIIMLAPRLDYNIEPGLYVCEYDDPELEDARKIIYITEDEIVLLSDGYLRREDGGRTEIASYSGYEYSSRTAIHLLGHFYFRDDDVASIRYFPAGTVPAALTSRLVTYAEYRIYDVDSYYSNGAVDHYGTIYRIGMTVKDGVSIIYDGFKYRKDENVADFLTFFGYLNSLVGR